MLSTRNLTKKGIPKRIPFLSIADKVLGRDYDLSLVFVGDKRARRINRETRNKDYPTNVLSFPLGPDSGEIIINVRKTERECSKFGKTFEEHLAFLFIHGALHLKGFTHGSRMESEERKLIHAFGFNDSPHRHRA